VKLGDVNIDNEGVVCASVLWKWKWNGSAFKCSSGWSGTGQ